MKNLFATLTVAMLMVSCGGGGGGDASVPAPAPAPTQVTATPLATSAIRAYQQGDTLQAMLTVRDLATGQSASGPVTLTVGDIVTNPYGVDCRSLEYSGTLTGSAGTMPYSVITLFYQDNNNSLHDCGGFDDGLGRYVFLTDTATSPDGIFLENGSPMQIGDSTSGLVSFDDGSWQDCTETVVAIENVTVPLGTFESYKLQESCSYSDGSLLDNTLWVVPSIYGLKESGVIDGLSLEISVTGYTFN